MKTTKETDLETAKLLRIAHNRQIAKAIASAVSENPDMDFFSIIEKIKLIVPEDFVNRPTSEEILARVRSLLEE